MNSKMIILLLIFHCVVFSQSGAIFHIEDLTKPESLLPLMNCNQILVDLIDLEAKIRNDLHGKHVNNVNNVKNVYHQIIAKNHTPDQMVNFGFHSFFNGMYRAYGEHRPFVLSPDMIWLLISQGFSRHVNNNTEVLRSMFVNFAGKKELNVRNDKICINNPKSPWEEVFPEFTKQIGQYTGNELINNLTSNFSTTTQVTKVASEITIMDAMKTYFDYDVTSIGCGIPDVTIEGNSKDWKLVLDKAIFLRKYKLDWWIDEIEPILKEFINASEGRFDKEFWKQMFKVHHSNLCGAGNIIDGWIIKFFPYSANGERNDLKILPGRVNLPDEIVKVDLKHISQNPNTFALKPEIGWMIKKKDIGDSKLDNK